MNNNKIMNLVVFYDNLDEVKQYVKRVNLQNQIDSVTLVITINKITSEQDYIELRELENKYNNIKIYNPKNNLGYLNGLIYGYENFKKDNNVSEYELFILSNTDIDYTSLNFFEYLLKHKYHEEIGVIAPSVYSQLNQSYENPQYKERPSLKKLERTIRIFETPVLSNLYMKAALIKARLKRKHKEESQYVYSAHGSYFIVTKEIMEILCNNKYPVLMYSEEAYIAELSILNQKKVFYDSEIEVVHEESTVTGKLAKSKKAKYIADSLKVIRKNFY